MSQKHVNKGIQQYVHSVHVLLATVIGLHFLVIGYFYPIQLLYIIFVPGTFFVLYKWVELVYIIEQANRDNLIALINASKNESTKKLLLTELWYADLHSLGANFFEDEHRIYK
tara:strand:- start:109 stop:447 length:339 start_codon:yes stop_codon:yes gene_type:complete